MSETAIRVENIGKLYRLGAPAQHSTLRDSIVHTLGTPRRMWERFSGRKIAPKPEEWFWALRNIGFEVQSGELVGVIGRNGAGKSTLLKILSRITAPTEGHAEITGRVGSLLEVGTGFHPELSGRENIYLNGAILGMRKAEIARKFDEIVAFSDIEKFLDTPVKHYSSGMYMRLAFSVAAHIETDILLVDEVLSVGDAEFQKKCLGKMNEVTRAGRTVLFVSHNLNAVEQLCHRVIMMEGGHIKTDSTDVRSVIGEYLFGSAENDASTSWTNEGAEFQHPSFRPLRVSLVHENGEPLQNPASRDASLWVEIDAEVERPHSALTVGYAIYSEDGVLLYWTYHSDCDWSSLQPGIIRLRGELPVQALNEGTYRLELIGGLHHIEWFFQPGCNAPHISLVIQGSLSESPLWLAKRPGILAPSLRWKRESLGNLPPKIISSENHPGEKLAARAAEGKTQA
jgi:lipopolysaccharide transport system ATP-binding protein